MANPDIANSSYLDFTGYRITAQTTVEAAYGLQASDVKKLSGSDSVGLDFAIVLPRSNDPTALLAENWGQREQTLASLTNSGTLWSTYGTSQTQFASVEKDIKDLGLTVLDSSNSNYVSSAASQTIWVKIDTAQQFKDLFGVDAYKSTASGNSFVFWNGNLEAPASWGVQGLWVDTDNSPPPSNLVGNVSTTLPQGPQGIGNSSDPTANLSPQAIAGLYDFPLSSQPYPTGPIGLIEPGIGDALPASQTQSFQQLLSQYLAKMGESGTGTVFVQGQDGQEYIDGDALERSLDVGVVSSINPNSNVWLYTGSGNNGNAQNTVYTALQSAIYYNDPAQNMPAVFSNSFGDDESMAPGSPFYYAYAQLFVDAALANDTIFTALGDGGSGDQTGNGLANVEYNVTSAYGVLVGGTSISSFASAQSDPTLDPTFVTQALALNPATIWQLVSGGLTSLPKDTAQLQDFIETVWNQYVVKGDRIGGVGGGYLSNNTGSGGVDPTQGVPSYQQNFGLNPTGADPLAQTGRGTPDVSANAGGNLDYIVPSPTMTGIFYDFGTSAASPLWASLAVRINAVFKDQGLPNLGYMNDFLYLAAAVAPASFNDITVGSNTSSFTMGGPYKSDGTAITPTGFGYSAAPGYDLASGLGTPNGELLARTMSEVAHAQIYFPNEPAVIDANGAGGWTSGAT
ncbi:MAG: S53 family peptidase, partial [Alphaproteobacteria bacterium]|nr:S53 family peptidase [Alphaproteobacteria bacterium]MBV8406555.1 S53 family peptidase [Alphaproteobacteria bacterium]